jgi:predicted ribosome quality control (RQC) complex YloA/Tae2 family protein
MIEDEYQENIKKGELLYEKYQMIHALFTEIKKAKEKHSWKDIKEKLKKIEQVKELKENEGKIILEI